MQQPQPGSGRQRWWLDFEEQRPGGDDKAKAAKRRTANRFMTGHHSHGRAYVAGLSTLPARRLAA